MRTFSYGAYQKNGASEHGLIEARCRSDAVNMLIRQGKRPFHVEHGVTTRRWYSIGMRRSAGASRLNLTRFFSDLAIMLQAGFTIEHALTATSIGLSRRQGKQAINAMVDRIKSGDQLSNALASHPETPANIIALVTSGEASGRLDVVISSIAHRLQVEDDRRSKLVEALIYPAFLLSVMLAAVAVIAFFLVPALLPVFEGSGAAPPLLVGLLDGLRDVLTRNAVVVMLAATALGGGVYLAVRRPAGRAILSGWAVRLPVIGSIIKQQGTGVYFLVLSWLVGNGVAINRALELAANACPVVAFRPALLSVRDSVVSGKSVGAALKDAKLFDDVTMALIAIGDEANNIPQSLYRAGTLLENRVEKTIARLQSVLTPVITIFVGLLIGGLVVSVMSALLSINSMALQ